MNILITGVAGFIGYNFALYQLKNNKKIKIYGLDNFDDYYSKKIKKFRVLELKKFFKDPSATQHFPALGNATISGLMVVADDTTGLAKEIQPIILGGSLQERK